MTSTPRLVRQDGLRGAFVSIRSPPPVFRGFCELSAVERVSIGRRLAPRECEGCMAVFETVGRGSIPRRGTGMQHVLGV